MTFTCHFESDIFHIQSSNGTHYNLFAKMRIWNISVKIKSKLPCVYKSVNIETNLDVKVQS